MRAMIVVPAGLVLAAAAYGLGRAGGSTSGAPPGPARVIERTLVRTESAPPRETLSAPETPLQDLHGELKLAVQNRSVVLNDLQNRLSSALAEGRMTGAQLLEMFRNETDASVLDLLQAALSEAPEAAGGPGVLQGFETIAQSDRLPARRQAAIAFLGSAWDRDGGIRRLLLSLAQSDGELSIRLTALGAMAAYTAKNGDQASAANAGLLKIARPAANGDDVRSQALSSLSIRDADEVVLRTLSGLLSDASPAVRLSSAERLAEAPPGFRASTLIALEGAVGREGDAQAKSILLANLVKAGRGESVGALERLAARDPQVRADAQDYLTILRAGYVEWADIQSEKSKRDAVTESASPKR